MSTESIPHVEFDEIQAMKGLVRTITPILEPYLGKMSVEQNNGTDEVEWVETTTPSIYLSYPNNPTPEFPRVILTYNSDTNLSTSTSCSGFEEIDGEDVYFVDTPVRYIVTLTCDSGLNQDVLLGLRKSANTILRKLRSKLVSDYNFRATLHQETASTLTDIGTINAVYSLEDTSYHNASTMSITFDTISRTYDDTGDVAYIDTVVVDSEVYSKCDGTPIVNKRTITNL